MPLTVAFTCGEVCQPGSLGCEFTTREMLVHHFRLCRCRSQPPIRAVIMELVQRGKNCNYDFNQLSGYSHDLARCVTMIIIPLLRLFNSLQK